MTQWREPPNRLPLAEPDPTTPLAIIAANPVEAVCLALFLLAMVGVGIAFLCMGA